MLKIHQEIIKIRKTTLPTPNVLPSFKLPIRKVIMKALHVNCDSERALSM